MLGATLMVEVLGVALLFFLLMAFFSLVTGTSHFLAVLRNAILLVHAVAHGIVQNYITPEILILVHNDGKVYASVQ